MKKVISMLMIASLPLTTLARGKINIAVLELEADGVTKSQSRTLTNKLRGELINSGRFDVIERSQMRAILDEQGFQQAGCTDEDCVVKIGQLIGVRRMIAGSVGKIEHTYVISLRLIDVEKGKIVRNANEEITGTLTDVLQVGIFNAARKIAGFTDGFRQLKNSKKDEQRDSASVWFVNLYSADNLYLDHSTKIIVDGNKRERVRKSLTEISPGRHIIHYDVNYRVRYYSEFIVKKGKNYIEPKFKENGLPGLSRHITWSPKKQENNAVANRKMTYFTYDEKNNKKKNQAILHLLINITEQHGESNELIFNYNWEIKLNEKTISSDKISEIRSQTSPDTYRKGVVIYSDNYHYYSINYYIIRRSTQLDIRSGYIEYK